MIQALVSGVRETHHTLCILRPDIPKGLPLSLISKPSYCRKFV